MGVEGRPATVVRLLGLPVDLQIRDGKPATPYSP